MRILRFLTGWRVDLRLAVRMLIRYPALSAIAVFGITVGIAIPTTMFTIVGEQLSPSDLPLPEGNRIVALQQWDSAKAQAEPIVPRDVVAWREELSTVRHIGAFRTVTKNLIVPPAAPEPIGIAEMSAAGFEAAGVAPVMGRVLRPEDERPGAAPVLVIGQAAWRGRFGANPNVLDTTVQLGDTHYTVVGVMPDGFAFPIDHAYWIPLRLDPSSQHVAPGPPLTVFGRLAGGATLQSAQAELGTVGERARPASPEAHQHLHLRIVPYAHQFAEADHPGNKLALQLARFFISVLLVVISINVAVLVYARTAARAAEIAVRTALGASRGRIIGQMFAEGLVLAGLGALAGVTVASVALAQVREALQSTEPLPFWIRFTISGQTIAYVVALTVAAAGVIGALPAWKATGPRVQNSLQALSAGGGSGMHLGRVWTALIILQVAFSSALLPMVVVRMSELAREGTAGFGFAADEYLVAQLFIEGTPGVLPRRFRELERRIADSGALRAMTFSSFAPGFEAGAAVRSEIGEPHARVRVNRIAVNFFDTFRVPILTGRGFISADAAPEARAVIVSRSFAESVLDGVAVLGARLRPATDAAEVQAITGLADDWYQIVGIVEDFPSPESGTAESKAKVYTAATPDALPALTLALQVHAADVEPWGTRLRHIAADVDPVLQVKNVMPLDTLLRQHQGNVRLLAGVFVAMMLSVVLLSAAGIYAMTAFAVTQRRREIGIRLALGAGARRILWTMFSRVAAQLLAGAGLGTGVAILLNSATGGALMKEHATTATAVVVVLMTTVGILAAFGPARQGLRIPPTEALRD